MSKKVKTEVAGNSADTVMDGVLSENQAKLNKLNSSIQAAYERRRIYYIYNNDLDARYILVLL